MRRSANWPDSHIRSLIDQRSARADIHGHYSTFSADSDTPSVCSRPYFSPKPSDNGDHSPYQSDYDYPSPALSSNPSHPSRLHDPTTSILDLDDDPRSSFAPSDSYEGDDDDERTYEAAEDSQPLSRMSYLGPKMRFHSRAPWELEEGALEEEEEPEESPRQFPPDFPFPRGTGAKSATSGSSSPRPSYTSRPSVESSRSQVPPKRSFETINSQISYSRGALYALAQESLSSHSLAQPQQKKTLRNKFSLGRIRSDSLSVPIPPSPCPSQTRTPVLCRLPSPQRIPDQPTQSFEQPTPSGNTVRFKKDPARTGDTMHPYANPDLAVSYAESPNSPSHSTLSLQPPSRNASSVTVTESYTLDSLPRTGIRSTLTSESSMNSVASKTRAPSIHLKGISSPIPLTPPSQKHNFPTPDRPDINPIPPEVNNLPGWMDKNATPAFSLISLEEARAQRMRSATSNDASRISSAMPNSIPSRDDAESAASTHGGDTSPYGSLTSRARGRSISAGSKTKNALQSIVGQPKPERRDSEPAIFSQQPNIGKTLKHKKSGFMRLFNGARLQEKEERANPPPVPSLPDLYSFNNRLPQRSPLPTVHRIPVPSVSPSLLDASSASSGSDGGTRKPEFQSPKRSLPYLSINTGQQGPSPRLPPPDTSDRSTLVQTMPPSTVERPWQLDHQPQSAPANVSDFPTLKLRPVSALFSAHFGDHIVTTEPRLSAETDTDTPTSSSPSGLISPVTPGSYPRSSNDQPFTLIHDDQSSVLKNLEQQMDMSRKAWQKHIKELEGQVRTLKTELEELKAKDAAHYCDACGRGKAKKEYLSTAPVNGAAANRARARTGAPSRFIDTLP